MKILKYEYMMEIGHGTGIIPPDVCMKTIMSAGSYYEMSHIDSWHSVFPTKNYCYSLMVTGKPWNRQVPTLPFKKLESLTEEKKIKILNFFQTHYCKQGYK